MKPAWDRQDQAQLLQSKVLEVFGAVETLVFTALLILILFNSTTVIEDKGGFGDSLLPMVSFETLINWLILTTRQPV